jgi:hypothetical protein
MRLTCSAVLVVLTANHCNAFMPRMPYSPSSTPSSLGLASTHIRSITVPCVPAPGSFALRMSSSDETDTVETDAVADADVPEARDEPTMETPTPSPPSPPDAPQAIYFGKEYERPSQLRGIDIKRFVTYNLLAVVLALGANFLGITSTLMSATNPTFFRSLGVDQLYAVEGYRRYSDVEDKYDFVFPSEWVMDQGVMTANARERELPMELRQRRSQVRPRVAFGPVKGSGKENLSVIKSSVMPGFNIQTVLGTPKEAAELLLSTVIAPPASGKSYTLLSAREEARRGQVYYTFEYTVQKESFFQHTVSVVTARGTELFTFTATVPEVQWGETGEKLLSSAESFAITSQSLPVGFY